MDHSTHIPLDPSEFNGETLEGAVIYGVDDERIGTVSHLHTTGPGAEVVLDVGGFLGIGTKHVALPIAQLTFMRDKDGTVHATSTWTKDALKELADHQHA